MKTEKERSKILETFQKRFPKAWFKDGREFNGDESAVLWSGEGSEVNGKSAFNPYWFESDAEEKVWQGGVILALVKLAEEFGLFWECHDNGTYFAREI